MNQNRLSFVSLLVISIFRLLRASVQPTSSRYELSPIRSESRCHSSIMVPASAVTLERWSVPLTVKIAFSSSLVVKLTNVAGTPLGVLNVGFNFFDKTSACFNSAATWISL